MKFSNLIAKPIISLFDCTTEGIVINAIFSENIRKIKALILENVKDEQNDEYLLNVKNIFQVGQDALMIKNQTFLEVNENLESNFINPINLRVFTINGINLGTISDFELDDSFNVITYYCNDNSFTPNQIVTFNDTLVLINTDDNEINISKFKPKIKNFKIKTKDDRIASVTPIISQTHINNNDQLFSSPFVNEPKKENQFDTIENNQSEMMQGPTFWQTQGYVTNQSKGTFSETLNQNIPRASTHPLSLIGRVLTQNIITNSGEIIAKQGSVITENTILLASANQKIRELSFYAK